MNHCQGYREFTHSTIDYLLFQLRVYDLAEGQGFKCLHKFDVGKEIDKWSSCRAEDATLTSGKFVNLYSEVLFFNILL